jgi:hypothetical protein
MIEKPQFEHKNRRIVAVSDAPRLGWGSVRGVVNDLSRRQTGSQNFVVDCPGYGAERDDMMSFGLTALPACEAVAFGSSGRMELRQ